VRVATIVGMRGAALRSRPAPRFQAIDETVDLVVVDLDDPGEVLASAPATRRRYFEDHYAELPFGLGTVPRRLDPDESFWTRPGSIAWIALALLGLLVAGSGH